MAIASLYELHREEFRLSVGGCIMTYLVTRLSRGTMGERSTGSMSLCPHGPLSRDRLRPKSCPPDHDILLWLLDAHGRCGPEFRRVDGLSMVLGHG